MTDQIYVERRSEDRFPVHSKATIILVDNPAQEIDGLLLDVSASGMKLICSQSLHIGTKVIVELDSHVVLTEIRYSYPRGPKFLLGGLKHKTIARLSLPDGASRAETIRLLTETTEPANDSAAMAAESISEPSVTETNIVEPSNAEPSNAEPSNAELSNAELSNAEPSNAEPSNAEPSNTEPRSAEPSVVESTSAESNGQPTDRAAADSHNAEPSPAIAGSMPLASLQTHWSPAQAGAPTARLDPTPENPVATEPWHKVQPAAALPQATRLDVAPADIPLTALLEHESGTATKTAAPPAAAGESSDKPVAKDSPAQATAKQAEPVQSIPTPKTSPEPAPEPSNQQSSRWTIAAGIAAGILVIGAAGYFWGPLQNGSQLRADAPNVAAPSAGHVVLRHVVIRSDAANSISGCSDTKETFEKNLVAGDTFEFDFDKKAIFRLASAGTGEISVDGKMLGAISRDGSVRAVTVEPGRFEYTTGLPADGSGDCPIQ